MNWKVAAQDLYYGAYFAGMALAGADYIAPLDDQSTAYAAYAMYEGNTPW